jgi:hypothetical protein
VVIGSGEYIGGLVGWLEEGATISNSYATGVVIGTGADEGDHGIGGLVGYSSGDISDSHAAGNVNGFAQVGGLVGSTGIATNITNSYATGDVSGVDNVGGLVGLLDEAHSITYSYATGDVTGSGEGVGGLVGLSVGDITSSSATGDVNGELYVGGLVGISVGDILFSYSTGDVIGVSAVGGLVGALTVGDLIASIYDDIIGSIGNSYSTGDVSGSETIGGLVGGIQGTMGSTPELYNSYAVGDVNGEVSVGGLVGGMLGGSIENSLASGDVIGDAAVGGLVGLALSPSKISYSYSIGSVPVSGENEFPQLIGDGDLIVGDSDPFLGYCDLSTEDVCYSAEFSYLELSLADYLEPALSVLNTEFEVFDTADNLNGGLPYLILNPPLADEDEVLADAPRYDFSFLSTQVLDVLKKSVGFTAAKSDLSKLDLALLDQVKSDKSAQIIGGKLFSYQSLSTSLSVGSLLQLEINFEANKSLQVWVKSSDDQYVLVGDVTFDKDGNAVLPGIEFKKSGQYELIFVNSDKKDLTQPELMNKVIGLTVYVN